MRSARARGSILNACSRRRPVRTSTTRCCGAPAAAAIPTAACRAHPCVALVLLSSCSCLGLRRAGGRRSALSPDAPDRRVCLPGHPDDLSEDLVRSPDRPGREFATKRLCSLCRWSWRLPLPFLTGRTVAGRAAAAAAATQAGAGPAGSRPLSSCSAGGENRSNTRSQVASRRPRWLVARKMDRSTAIAMGVRFSGAKWRAGESMARTVFDSAECPRSSTSLCY